MKRDNLLLTAVNGWAPAIFASSVALRQKREDVGEDSLAAISTMEVDTAKKKSETGLRGDKEEICKQSIVGKGSKKQPQK